MRRYRLQIVFGVLFIMLSLVSVQFARFQPTTHAIRLASVNQRAQECMHMVELSVEVCAVCVNPDITPGRVDEPMGFPFTDYLSSICPGPPIRNAEMLDEASAVIVSAVGVGGLYLVFTKLRKAQARGH